jgi:hypothetical protein
MVVRRERLVGTNSWVETAKKRCFANSGRQAQELLQIMFREFLDAGVISLEE